MGTSIASPPLKTLASAGQTPQAAALVRLHVGGQSRRGAALAQRRVGSLAINRAAFENASNEKGERLIWLPPDALAKLKALRGPGESFSDVILALAKESLIGVASVINSPPNQSWVLGIRKGAAPNLCRIVGAIAANLVLDISSVPVRSC